MTLSEMGFYGAAGVPLVAVLAIYAAGARRRAGAGGRVFAPRHVAFVSGIALLFLSLQWPFARWAHELFSVHQLGILIARIVSPILIVVGRPSALLVTGLSRSFRKKLLRPFLLWQPLRTTWPMVTHPAISLIFYILALYFWELPVAQAAALDHVPIGLLMHFSLLLTGLLFWSRILERRPPPHGVSHGVRLMMIWLAILSQISLGAYITVKISVLYPAYSATEQLLKVSPIVDEARGGLVIWVASALLCLGALIAVIDLWCRHETKMNDKRLQWTPSNSAILLYPETARALREMARPKNRRLAFGLVTFAVLIFVAICGMVGGSYRINRRENIKLYMLSRS